MKKIPFLMAFLALLMVPMMASGYEFLSVYQNDSSSDNVVEAPSFYWPGQCDVNINLLGTASHTGAFSFSNEWFSPDDALFATSTPTYQNDITCLSQGVPTEDTSLNNFYESKTETLSTATSTNTWTRTVYNCTPDEDLNILYSNTAVLDSHDHFPYGYLENTGGYCQIGSANPLPTISTRLTLITNYIKDRYDTECSSLDLEIAEIGGASATCVFNRFFGTTFWYIVPFTSGSAGIVNISILEQVEIETGLCSMNCITNNTYLYDTVLDSTTSLGITLPLTQNLVLQRDRDYWLLLGTECHGTTGGSGSCTIGFNHSEYNITIFAYEPAFVCGDWSVCDEGIQTRVCVDQGNLVPDSIETRSCFDTPTFDLTLGFEEFRNINDGVYLCQKEFWLVTCLLSLRTIDALYPVNWTVFPDRDNAGVARDNFVKMSSETASVGSRSLKMWYIPPKLEEPVNDGAGSTVCGNASTGSFPEVNTPYNETLFISQNITFANPFPQIRYDIRKCNEPVLQYDLNVPFGCGKLCYASSCNETPSGRYGVRISRLAGNLVPIIEGFNMTNGTGIDITANVTDGKITTWGPFLTESGVIVINSTSNIFFNGTRVNFILNVTFPVAANMCFFDTSNNMELARFPMGVSDAIETFNITLANITSQSGIDEINFSSCGGGDQNASMFEFQVVNFENLTTSAIVFDYVGFAPTTWDAGQIIHDLSNIDLDLNTNYTVSLSVNPENQYDPTSHCVYMDNFRVTFTEIALPECISECIPASIDRRIASLSNGVCTFITQKNSPDCIGNIQDRDAINDILAGLGGGDVSDNSTCIDSDNDGIRDDLYIFDKVIGSSEIVIDSAACLLLINETADAQKGVTPLQSAQDWVDWILFLVSPIFIFFYITIAISAPVGALVKSWQAFGITFAFMLFIGMLIPVPGGTSSVVPIGVGIAMIAVISLLIAKELRNSGVGGGG